MRNFILIFTIIFHLCFSLHAWGNVLTQKDVQTYKKIFDLQKSGQIKQAQKKQSEIKNHSLMGYVLYLRYFLHFC